MKKLIFLICVIAVILLSYFAIYYSIKEQPIFSSNKVEIFQIQANPYYVNINVIITQDTVKALAYVNEHTDSSFTIKDFRKAEAVTFVGSGNPTVWFPYLTRSTEDISKATHELMHILHFVTSEAGIVLSDETHEAFAYELDYLTLQLFKHIK